MQRFAKMFSVCLILLLASIIGSQATLAQNATVTVSPPSGPQDARFVIELTGLDPDTTYTVDFVYEETGAAVFRLETTSDADGNALISIRSEPSDPPGVYLVQVLDAGGTQIAEGAFTLIGAADSPSQPAPSSGGGNVQVVPRAATVGAVYNILASGLEAGEGVIVEIRDPDNSVVYNRLRNADNSGRFQVEIFTQRGDTPGTYTVRLLDRTSNVLAEATFEVNELSGRMGELSIMPTSGPAGSSFTIRATGLRQFVDVQVRVASDATGQFVYIATVRTNVDGTLETTFDAEDTLQAGAYTVTIEESGDVVATAPLTIEQPPVATTEVTVTPQLGLPGDQYTFDVTGLEPNTTFDFVIALGDNEVFATERTADSAGNFSLTLGTGTGDALGDYSVQVRQAGAVLAEATLTLVAELPRNIIVNIAPESGEAGETFIVTAVGLDAEEAVTVEISRDDEAVFSAPATADINGSMVVTYESQADSAPGTYSVRLLGTDADLLGETTLVFEDTRPTSVVEIAPRVAPAGTTRIITAIGLTPGETFTVEVLRGDQVIYSEDETANANGSIALNLPGSQADVPGEYSVRLLRDGEALAENTLVAEGDIPAEPEEVVISIDPTSGPIGTTYEINVAGLPAAETVTINVTLDGESVFSTERTADGDGRIQLFIGSEAGDPLGQYGVNVVRDGETLAEIAFFVGEETDVVDEPDDPTPAEVLVVVEPQAGERGTIHIVTVTGLEQGDPVTLTVTLAGETVFAAERIANANGSIRVNLQSELDDTPGNYTVTVTRAGAALADAVLTITDGETPPDVVDQPQAGAVRVDIVPQAGPVGTSHAVRITGLPAGETVTLDVLYDGAVDFTTERTADANGVITINLVAAEGDPLGTYTINVVQGGAVIASGDLLVEPLDVVEPLAQPQQPPAVSAPADADVFSGSLTEATPTQTFTFEGEADEAVFIRLNSDDFDTFLILRDATGQELASNDDASGTLNSAIGPLLLPATGRYTLEATSFDFIQLGDPVSGAFDLTILRPSLLPLVYGDPASTRFDAEQTTEFYRFDAEIGDILDMTVESADGVDTTLTLTAPDGTQAAFDDDSGAGLNPELTRYIVQEDGDYLLTLDTFTPGDTGTVTLLIERQAARSLSDGAQQVRLNAKQAQDILRLEGTAGQQVRMSVSVVSGQTQGIDITVTQGNQTLMAYGSTGIPGEVTLGFIVQDDGTIAVLVTDSGNNNTILEFEVVD